VQNWCPKCLAQPDHLETAGSARFREHTEHLKDTYDAEDLWDAFGVVEGVVPFTHRFPRADIHELLTPDLLHQVIKGTFKDHLVTWIQEYIEATNSKRDAQRIMDDIDRKIAAVPAFPGLRRFPQGRNYKQWTGDDSKALMKVFVPAIVGHVPERMVQAIIAFLDFCYLARRPNHTPTSLAAMDTALRRFHELREVFREEDIRPEGFSLPRQHALVHYIRGIKLFGSPYGLCSSITESKHIHAVKKPWRRSSRYRPLPQILQTNLRMDKIAAARVDFGSRGMIKGDVLSAAFQEAGVDLDVEDEEPTPEEVEAIEGGGQGDVGDAPNDAGPLTVTMGKCASSVSTIASLALELGLTSDALTTSIRRFLYSQVYPDPDLPADDAPLNECPAFSGSINIYPSARATFFAPSELAGPGGMHSEVIRSTASWFQQYERRDTVLIQNGGEDDVMGGMLVGRVMRFMTRAAGRRTLGVVHLDTIVRSCHLIGVYDSTYLPKDFHFSHTHVAFRAFYVNRYSDYHMHEILP
ncbi:hypothetical protein FA95DRAFT_1659879, partial [Auriscalpium vulgare]